jgi:hypothetical protein
VSEHWPNVVIGAAAAIERGEDTIAMSWMDQAEGITKPWLGEPDTLASRHFMTAALETIVYLARRLAECRGLTAEGVLRELAHIAGSAERGLLDLG